MSVIVPFTYINPIPGSYCPRVYRPSTPWPTHAREFKAVAAAGSSFQLLVQRVDAILRVIEPDSANMSAYGHEIRRELIVACTEVEAGLSAVLRDNSYKSSGNLTMRDYVKLAGPLALDQYSVALQFHLDHRFMVPFDNWDPRNGLEWYQAYNKTKHDRETHLNEATLGRLLSATAACLVVAEATFGPQLAGPKGPFGQPLFTISNRPQLTIDDYQGPGTGNVWNVQPLPV